MTGPGTHITWRWRLSAQPAVLSAPLRRAASTTTVPLVSAAINRLRARKRGRVGADDGGRSLAAVVESDLDLATRRGHRDHMVVGDDESVLGQNDAGTLAPSPLTTHIDRHHTRQDLVRHRLDGAVRGFALRLGDADRRGQSAAGSTRSAGHARSDPAAKATRDQHGREDAGDEQPATGLLRLLAGRRIRLGPWPGRREHRGRLAARRVRAGLLWSRLL